MLKLLRRGPYEGRLAFDSDSGFHVAVNGRRVVTDDGGKTWRYARRGDTSHNARHQQRAVTIDSTANRLAELTLQQGGVIAAEQVDPHHYEVQTDDQHFDHSAPGLTSLKHDPDVDAAIVTSHTKAYQ